MRIGEAEREREGVMGKEEAGGGGEAEGCPGEGFVGTDQGTNAPKASRIALPFFCLSTFLFFAFLHHSEKASVC